MKNTEHFLKFPAGTTLFGATLPMDGKATFNVTEDDVIEFTDVVGTVGKQVFDLSYLTQEELTATMFASSVLQNKAQWDIEEIWYRLPEVQNNGMVKLSIVK